jgi:hypothetical protein
MPASRARTGRIERDETQSFSIIANALLGGKHWVRGDGAYATLTPMAYSLVLYSQEGIEAARQAAAAKEQKRKASVPKF